MNVNRLSTRKNVYMYMYEKDNERFIDESVAGSLRNYFLAHNPVVGLV